ncbi:hypothetical protein NUU61_003758 [Penicillium alfredii]|uniref:Transcription factor Iwr1 domain-containing protein n=1 Tax=Penicillium alfredii TaxID=1506179 RepID=A0A9W9KD68_9EURO|nr:uncharacterized protein NUU61_003758 [Penicillium alfredii]KAJ5101536.1 hypothetical protein NUU61_003758 [Penicillium alfredii]
MALPPEQINIKRRREEEPVETLYIQSALHQTKRRFTDFVFQRVPLKTDDDAADDPASAPAPAHPAAQRLLRSPRSVSSLHIPARRAPPQQSSSSGVPMVRATSPGAEFREAQRLAAARKESGDKLKRALYSSPVPSESQDAPDTGISAAPSTRETTPGSGARPSSARAHPLRRFQISRGIQKRRADGSVPGVAVLVEQLRRKPHSRQASMVADLAVQQAQSEAPSSPVKPRKRPVVNQAEKQWREERKGAISAAKQHLSDTLEKSAQAQQTTWDDESDRLAREFEQVALEIEEQDQQQHMDVDPTQATHTRTPLASQQHTPGSPHKQPLKYQPRPPKQPRTAPASSQPPAEREESGMGDVSAPREADDNDGDYVYDVYIRRPLAESEMLTNPLAEFESDQQQKHAEASHRGVGVIVITAEDEEYWEHFIEDDEEEWDSEDADSNAENNPANDYPDEELSSSDEDDDPSAIYSRYRHRGASDDEEYDLDDSASESGARYGGWVSRRRFDRHVDSDESY